MRIACRANTDIGIFTALYENGIIKRVLFPNEPFEAVNIRVDDTLPFAKQIEEYLVGRRMSFSLPIFISGTPFRQDVYQATMNIPYGKTATYAEVAFAAGYPRAMRAVGSTMKDNQLPILIPCHRVIHQSSKKHAYRGGMDLKHYLLNIESKYINN